MKPSVKAFLRIFPVMLLLAALCLAAWLHAPDAFSLAERRPLAQMPELTAETVLNGKFMSGFDSYSMDQFPLRESFRRLKTLIQYRLLGQKDVNGVFVAEGSAAKIEGPLKEQSVTDAAAKLRAVFDRYFAESGSKAYFAMVPDKPFYLAEKHGYPGLDYPRLQQLLHQHTDFAQWIDLTGTLDITDYYATDSHWRQERLEQAALALAQTMGAQVAQDYESVTVREDFRGVYAGQSALPLPGEKLSYLTSPVLEDCTLYDYETDRTTGLYDLEGARGRDPYDLFLSGAAALQDIENPHDTAGRELVIFRDSFGSSMAPLLVPGYARVTLVDLRYLSSNLLGQFVEGRGQDVLFLLSPGLLNSSNLIK